MALKSISQITGNFLVCKAEVGSVWSYNVHG